ncbi:BREX-1 system adenine-specific DNA-methyltransferase PglX [Acetobacterium malicum]|uniref:site-specific DNA-methyltransferase (adenine-specific) n=1 Tax=Acetobacterium malicum TaxID=52692 RepID=A0ABR6YZK2_9FIRM|nr:BREX-1 system adenine-specific DNA-methyltransferase PglX [Acetobacterium malicum]MBC3900613.1 BREX-1 system adenine-specific DNA-methyltransferase PglX [Acetobacterium malicum]
MNKTAIKEFAVEARKKLIASVKDKAGKIGITEDSITTAITIGSGFAVFPTHFGTETKLAGKELLQRENLISQIKEKGYNAVMEEVAYTWFNRIIAIRFMEVNDYLPTRVRVLSSETKDKFEPDLVTLAPVIELDFTPSEKDEILSLKMKNELDNLFRMLLIRQCNTLGEILPELFENTSTANRDYTEILLDISYTKEDSVIRDLLKIDEADFRDAVEIIGWMYQYYNTEPKDETFALLKKNVKITKERIPSATQLFTPDWIVRYMVENSLGRLWLEHCQAEAGLSNEYLNASYFGWKYYLEEAEQEPEVRVQLEMLRQDTKNLSPEDIKVIDPCMGSGHILVYAFEVLMQIYESCGYTQRDAARLIIEKNLYGLDIDDRAFQLAYFAVMMKGRKYNRRILTSEIQTNLCSIQESNAIKTGLISFIADGEKKLLRDTQALIEVFTDAKEYGSILEMPEIDFVGISKRVNEINEAVYDNIMDRIIQDDVRNHLIPLIKQAEIMVQKYDAVITNPPYMGSSGMGTELSGNINNNFSFGKVDLGIVFIEKCIRFCKTLAFCGMLTQQAFMFLQSYEKVRMFLQGNDIINMVHLGAHAFEEIAGEIVQTTAFVVRKSNIENFCSSYARLVELDSQKKKELAYLKRENIYYTQKHKFFKIPNKPMVYWASDSAMNLFEENILFNNVSEIRSGISTGDNDRFYRLWYECYSNNIGFRSDETPENSNYKWFPIVRAGNYRKWWGNAENVLNLHNAAIEIKMSKNNFRLRTPEYYNKLGITWCRVGTEKVGFRIKAENLNFGENSPTLFVDEMNAHYTCALLNSRVAAYLLFLINPTINFQVGDIKNIPFILSPQKKILVDSISQECIDISRCEWDSFETSWDFKRHPLLDNQNRHYASFANDDRIFPKNEIDQIPSKHSLALAYRNWQTFTENQFAQLKANEEKLNRIFIEIYGLADELTPEVEDKDVTIRKADLGRDIRSLISYAVGCMLGRYSLDTPGLAYAGGEWEADQYTTIIPDKDNIIPITDSEYFDDDMVARLVNFIKVVYGEASLEENLDFIAGALGNKGNTAREVIRNYFLKDFYKDHVKIYQKRPIYWLFDSGKENGFKALIYMHRYDQDTVGRVRTDYLHKIQAKLEDSLNHCNVILASEAPAGEKAAAVKKKEKLIKQLAETRLYDQAIAHIALSRLAIDLDDGVKVNYAKFQDVEVASEGKKAVKVNLLAKI